jgi:Cap4 SAVED domain
MSGFFEVIVHDLQQNPSLTGLCAGYERGEWRSNQLAKKIMRELPDFALRHSEKEGLSHENAMKSIAEAALTIYQTEKYAKRGEFGELLLHVILKELFNTIPAVSKIYFKDAPNDTVKGFDAVHVVASEDDLELWLGEVKFYKSISSAITDVTEELEKHLDTNYLRNEFLLVSHKIDDAWPHADKLNKLIDPDTSLDKVFKTVCIPVLLTYDSDTTKRFSELTDDYKRELLAELTTHYKKFEEKSPIKNLRVRLILFPLQDKTLLVSELHKILEAAKCL